LVRPYGLVMFSVGAKICARYGVEPLIKRKRYGG